MALLDEHNVMLNKNAQHNIAGSSTCLIRDNDNQYHKKQNNKFRCRDSHLYSIKASKHSRNYIPPTLTFNKSGFCPPTLFTGFE
jgi:hypothetical protein